MKSVPLVKCRLYIYNLLYNSTLKTQVMGSYSAYTQVETESIT